MKRTENFDIEFNNQFASIGRFVVEFESILEWIRFDLSTIMQYAGLDQRGLTEVIFGQKVFTAGPLLNCYEQLCNELINGNNGDKKSGKSILKRISDFKKQFDKQIQVRNDLLHSYYQIDYSIHESTGVIEAMKLRAFKNSPKKQGKNLKITVSSKEDIQSYIETLVELKKIERQIFIDLINYMRENNMGNKAYDL